MKKWMVVTLVAVTLFVLGLPLIGFTMWVSLNNREVSLRNEVGAQQKSCELVFDQTWKVVSQQAQIAQEGKKAFMELYPKLMEGRYGNARGGSLLSFIQEQNPQFDMSLFKQLSASVESQRANLTHEEKRLADLEREHRNTLQTFPGSLFLAGRQPVVIKLVTSGATKEAFNTGEENDTKLFDAK